MVFSSHIFIFYFLPIFLLIYYILPFQWRRLYLKNSFITISSYIFYGWLVPWFVLLMFLSTTWDYICGKIITKPGQVQWKRKTALWVAIVGDMGLLMFYKYYMFFMGGVNHLVEVFGGGPETFHIATVLLPAGISFYTFVALSYTIDLYRGEAQQARNFPTFSCFIGLFPHLIAGPIIRYHDVASQLAERQHTIAKFSSGIAIFCLGMAKKIIFADSSGRVVAAVFTADDPGAFNAWWGILAYHFQIYFDFCGYSDMAVGLARMLGIEFVKNFDGPYRATSVTVFWRRWHMTLSTFIRDYLYIPMGGNRCGPARNYFNLVTSMFLCGLWHGAKMTFVVWGVLQGAMMIIERLNNKRTLYWWAPVFVQILLTNVFTLFCWVMFRASSIEDAWMYWKTMVGMMPASPAASLLTAEIFTPRHIVEMSIATVLVLQPVQAYDWVKNLTTTKMVICIALFLFAIASMFSQSFSPFLYFQF